VETLTYRVAWNIEKAALESTNLAASGSLNTKKEKQP
jgi:hypothetical protein